MQWQFLTASRLLMGLLQKCSFLNYAHFGTKPFLQVVVAPLTSICARLELKRGEKNPLRTLWACKPQSVVHVALKWNGFNPVGHTSWNMNCFSFWVKKPEGGHQSFVYCMEEPSLCVSSLNQLSFQLRSGSSDILKTTTEGNLIVTEISKVLLCCFCRDGGRFQPPISGNLSTKTSGVLFSQWMVCMCSLNA